MYWKIVHDLRRKKRKVCFFFVVDYFEFGTYYFNFTERNNREVKVHIYTGGDGKMGKKNSKLKQETIEELIRDTYCE